jgi:hypothetical protein
MKRYLLFVGEVYYPVGGWYEFVHHFDTLGEAREAAQRIVARTGEQEEWWHVVDAQTGEMFE